MNKFRRLLEFKWIKSIDILKVLKNIFIMFFPSKSFCPNKLLWFFGKITLKANEYSLVAYLKIRKSSNFLILVALIYFFYKEILILEITQKNSIFSHIHEGDYIHETRLNHLHNHQDILIFFSF